MPWSVALQDPCRETSWVCHSLACPPRLELVPKKCTLREDLWEGGIDTSCSQLAAVHVLHTHTCG